MRCPVCRANNNDGLSCRRCRADLTLLVELEQQRAHLLHEAQQAAAGHDWREMTRLAEKAHSLRRAADSARLLAVGRLLQRDFAGAFAAYQTIKATG